MACSCCCSLRCNSIMHSPITNTVTGAFTTVSSQGKAGCRAGIKKDARRGAYRYYFLSQVEQNRFDWPMAGKSTKALLQSTTLSTSTACVAVPLTVTRSAALAKIGRFVPLIVRLASDDVIVVAFGESVTTLFKLITRGYCGLSKPPVLALKPCSLMAVLPRMRTLSSVISWKFGYRGPAAGNALVL